MQWMSFSITHSFLVGTRFRATGAVTTLRLADVTGLSDLRGLVLDGLSVVLVGEPRL
jgi:hypothetical protein